MDSQVALSPIGTAIPIQLRLHLDDHHDLNGAVDVIQQIMVAQT